jgi:hypothetical protein
MFNASLSGEVWIERRAMAPYASSNLEAAQQQPSVQSFIYFGADALATLRASHGILGVARECRIQSGRMSRRSMPNRQTTEEQAQIERELDILRTRHALMVRWGRVARVFVAIVLPIALAGAFLYALVIDIVVGLYIIGVSAVALAALWVVCGTTRHRERDRTTLPPSQFYPAGLAFSQAWYFPPQKSELATIEDMIALREKRLAGLKRASPP